MYMHNQYPSAIANNAVRALLKICLCVHSFDHHLVFRLIMSTRVYYRYSLRTSCWFDYL